MRLGSPKGVEIAETCDASGKKHKQGCCSVNDAADARRVAGLLDIPFYVLNFEEEFGRVIDYFVGEYNAGRTPNPCVRCNDWLKFGKLAQYAEAAGAEFVASGHYARLAEHPETGERTLARGVDHSKDQSYVLFGMGARSVSRTMLPIGGLEKTRVRAMAEERGLPVFGKPDSQEICFVPDQDYASLVRRRSPESFRAGNIVTEEGAVVGTHAGHQQFTIGQRKGLSVSLGHRIFVVDIDAKSSTVVVGGKERLFRRSLRADQANWLTPGWLAGGGGERRVRAKIRYNHEPQAGVVRKVGEREFVVEFDEGQAAITPGQACVCYDGELVVCGGWISGAE